jgi:CTP synthase
LPDAYISINAALDHAGLAHNVKVKTFWSPLKIWSTPQGVKILNEVDGILVPGGFGERGIEGKIMLFVKPVKRKFHFLVYAWVCSVL